MSTQEPLQTSPQPPTPEEALHVGQAAFERGLYRQAIEQLVQAVALCDRNTRLGGDIQMWLVSAYQAAQERDAALTLCRQLTQHPYGEIRKQSKRLLYILEAPQLATRPEWITEIPDLETVSDQNSMPQMAASRTIKPPEPAKFVIQDPIDPSQVDTEDNGFIGVAMLAIILLLAGALWFST